MGRTTTYDLVLLDWHLAEHKGAQSLEQLREAGCAARIVVLSGETASALIGRSVELGAAGFIPKTYSSEMIAALQQVLAVELPPIEHARPLHLRQATSSSFSSAST